MAHRLWPAADSTEKVAHPVDDDLVIPEGEHLALDKPLDLPFLSGQALDSH
ncbi:MAG: hypothetical protein MUC34_12730 [Anaerolineae bacterium]|nr:hypothetical protein [Anaerolineae bacterium]